MSDKLPEAIAEKHRVGEVDGMDAVRRYAATTDWGSGDLMPNSTKQFRAQFHKQALVHWS